jgi:general secretion pathway protein A
MYNEYFGLKDSPFSIAPDPRYLYMSEQHREALAHLVYGFNSDGSFVLLTGEVGTGKTTVCRCLLERIPEDSAIAFILNPKLTVEELLATICDEFVIEFPKENTSIKVFVDLINAYLLDAHARGRKAVLIIDEAQNLSSDVLEQLRLLTNLETLRDKLSQPGLRQLSQRIIARYHLGALSKKEVGAYVAHRLAVAGSRTKLFPDSTINKLYHLSGGVPRLINVLCDRSLLGTYTQGRNEVNKSTLKKAAREVFGEMETHVQVPYRKAAAWILSILVLIVVGVVLASTYYNDESKKAVVNEIIEPDIIESLQLQSLHWPDNQPISRSSDMAFQELFKLWNIAYQSERNNPVCDQAKANGIKCYRGLGNLSSLRNLNRPAVLKLFDDEGREYYAALTALKEKSAVLVVGAETREVPIEDIESHWLGDYILLWRPPSDYNNVIKPGMQDPLVQWLDNQLALVQGRTNQPRENLEFDNELLKQVKKYQLAKGLIPDGIVGAQTLIHLNTAVDSDIPTLIKNQEDN